jgi:hypothetical protein
MRAAIASDPDFKRRLLEDATAAVNADGHTSPGYRPSGTSRHRTVRAPCAIRVWDSTAETRYISMIGTTQALPPQPATR